MNLLDALLAAAREGRNLDLDDATAAAAPAPIDPAYTAYCAKVEAGNARRTACKRCGGLGCFPEYAHRNGGACFACGGNCLRVEAPLPYRDWLKAQAEAAGIAGFDVMVQE